MSKFRYCTVCGEDIPYDTAHAHETELVAIQPTLRDRFAMAAIGDIYSTFIRESGNSCGDPEWRYGIAADAYALADAMMKAREEKP